MEIEGKIIIDLGKTEGTSKAGNHWQKREWVLETLNTQYPRKVKFHIFGDKADQMIFEVGKNYVISYDIESREFNERWYTDISCYAMRPAAEAGYQQPSPQGGMGGFPSSPQPGIDPFNAAPSPGTDFSTEDPNDDLPF